MKKSIFYRKPILFSLVLAAALCWPLNALAQGTGMYFSVFGGGTYVEDSEIDNSGGSEYTFDTGWNVGGAIGHDYGNFRAELELAYRENDFDTLEIPGFAPIPALNGENISAFTYMVSFYWDFHNNSTITPYIGAGIGGATIEISDDFGFDDDDTVLAYKGSAGISLNLAPNMDLLLDYTYLATTDPEFLGGSLEMEYATHNLSGGLRFRF